MTMLQLPFNPARDHYFGSLHAPVEILQYGDFQCEYCADVYPIIKLLQEAMGHRMKFVYRHYPLHLVHPFSLQAAVAAEAAAVQDRFWHMHDMIFENQKFLTRTSFNHFAEEIELDTLAFEDCREHKKLFHKVITDFESGVKSGVDGTPTFFINGVRYDGFDDFDSMYETCQYAMQEKPGVRNRQIMSR